MAKVLQICVEGNTGSTGRMAEQLGNKVLSLGSVSYIAYGRFPRPSNSKTIKIGNKIEIAMHGIQTRIFDTHGFGSIYGTQKLVEEMKMIKPDLIHLHHLHGYYLNIKVLFNYLSKANIPVIWTFHDCWSITGHCTHFDYIGCSKWEEECNNCPQKNEYPSSLFFDNSKQNYYLKKELFNSVQNLTIVSVSKWLDKIVSKSFLSNVDREVIYNGIDMDLFLPCKNTNELKIKYNLRNRFIILGVATTWSNRKGLDDFIKLSNSLNSNEVIVLIGLNQKQINDIPDNIIGVERTENQLELRDFYNISNVFMNLSVEETFGLTTVEAMACGTPVIVYNSTASPELVDENTGVIVNRDEDFLVNLVSSIEEVKKKGKKYFSKNCRSRAKLFFDKKDMLQNYIELYRKIINKKN